MSTCESLQVDPNGGDSVPTQWQTDLVPDLPVAVSNHAACEHNGWLYITGGFTRYIDNSDLDDTRHVYRWRVNQSAWEPCQDMRKKRNNHGMTASGTCIFVFGGHTTAYSGEMYDESTNQWTLLTSMSGPQCPAAVCCISGVLYVTGPRQKVYVYHPDKQQWRTDDQGLPWGIWWLSLCVWTEVNTFTQHHSGGPMPDM